MHVHSRAEVPAAGDDANVRSQMIASAYELAPKLKLRAEQAATQKRVPDETIADFHDAGLFRLAQPKRYGGHEMGWDVLCEISQILAMADGSQAWIHRIMADHAQMVATFPLESQDDVWGKDTRALISASFDPAGRATRVDGGFRFSGRHKFASGIDHASWLICGGFLQNGDNLEGPHFFLVPKTAVTVIYDWDTVGLEGTGSNSFEVKDVFLPEHRLLNGELARIGRAPGTKINKAVVYRTPRGGVTSTGFAALSVGMAKSVLNEWLGFAQPRVINGVALQTKPGNQFVAAEASAEIDAAELLYSGTINRSMRILEAGGNLEDFDLLTARRNVSFSCKLALSAGAKLFSAAGANALYNRHRLSQQYRNLLASGAHFAVAWDAHGPAFGKAFIERGPNKL